jgi:hypothetical protein
MFGITDVSAGQEAHYRPFRDNSGDSPATPIRIATAPELAAYVTKALFDANTIIKADTDDTPSALAVGASTIVGRAATGGIAALTAAQVATLLNGLVDPAAHALGGAAHSADTIANVNSKISDADLPHDVQGTTTAVGDKFEIVQGAHTGSTDKFAVENLDLTALDTLTVTSRTYRQFATNDRYIAAGTSTQDLIIFDRATGEELYAYSGVLPGAVVPLCFISEDEVATSYTATVRVYNIHDGSYTNNTITGMGSSDAIACHPNGNVYILDNNDDMWTIDTSDWSSSSDAVTGATLTGDVISIDVDGDASYAYVIEGAGSGSAVWLRKVDLSDGTVDASLELGTSTVGIASNTVAVVGSEISVLIGLTSETSKLERKFSTSLTEIYTGTTSLSIYFGAYGSGLYYCSDTGTSTSLKRLQLANLTQYVPAFEDKRNTDGVNSSESVLDDNGDPWVCTHADIIRSTKQYVEGRGRAMTTREITADDDVELFDLGNAILVPSTRTTQVDIGLSTDVQAAEGYQFSVYVEYNATYSVTVSVSGSASGGGMWELNGKANSLYPSRFLFSIINGEPSCVCDPDIVTPS